MVFIISRNGDPNKPIEYLTLGLAIQVYESYSQNAQYFVREILQVFEKTTKLHFHILGKLILLDKVLKTIKQDDLLENTRQAGDVLLTGLKELQAKFPQYLNSARGLGTFCAINCDSGPR